MAQDIVNFIKVKKNQKLLVCIAIWIGLVGTAYLLRSVMLPFVIALMLAYVLEPAVSYLQRSRVKGSPLPRWFCVVLIYFILFLALAVLGAFFMPEIYREVIRIAKDISEFITSIDEAQIQSFAHDLDDFFKRNNLPVEILAPTTDAVAQGIHDPIVKSASGSGHLISVDIIQLSKQIISDMLYFIKQSSANIVSEIHAIAIKLFETIFKASLIFMIAAFFLMDSDRIKDFVFMLIPSENRKNFDDFLKRIDIGLSGVVRGQLIICTINAILTLIGLLLLNVKFAFTLATIAGVLSLIPIFGSIISTVPIAFVALSTSPITALMALVWIVFIHGLEANLLNPKIMGESAKIHPIIIILSLLAGEHFYGMIGALLAVPVTSIIITTFWAILTKLLPVEGGVAKRR